MLKPLLGMAAAGVVTLLLWKMLALFILPLLGVALAAVFVVFKVVFIAGSILLAIWIFRRMSRSEASA
jgi:hypothetical protein